MMLLKLESHHDYSNYVFSPATEILSSGRAIISVDVPGARRERRVEEEARLMGSHLNMTPIHTRVAKSRMTLMNFY